MIAKQTRQTTTGEEEKYCDEGEHCGEDEYCNEYSRYKIGVWGNSWSLQY